MVGATGQDSEALAKGGIQGFDVSSMDHSATLGGLQLALNDRLTALDDAPLDAECASCRLFY